MHRSIVQSTAVLQSSPKCISIERHVGGSITQTVFDVSIRIKNLVQDGNNIAVHNGIDVEMYSFEGKRAVLISEFKSHWPIVALREETLYRLAGATVECCTLRGVVSHSISFTDGEGDPILLDISDDYLAVGTENGIIKVYELSRRTPKLIGTQGNLQVG